MELIEIQAFAMIAEHSNFTRAADALFISQPAISRRIALLERELGVPLFERLPSGVRLTDAGGAFLPYARHAIASLGDGVAAVRTLQDGFHGEVSLALVGTLASTTLLRRLAVFRDAHPDVRLMLQTARSDEVGVLVQKGDAALGLRYFEDVSPALVSEQVALEELGIVCSGHSRLVPNNVRFAQDLRGIPWVTFPTGTRSSGEPFARELDRLVDKLGLGGSERILIDSLTAQKRMIESDFGIGLMPGSAVTEEIRLGSLRGIVIEGGAMTVPIHLLTRVDGYESAAMTRLIAALRQRA